MSRPRAADDFAVIRARIEKLQRERASVSAESEPSSGSAPRRVSGSTGPVPEERPGVAPPLRRNLSRFSRGPKGHV